MAVGVYKERLESGKVHDDLLGHALPAHAEHSELQVVGDPGGHRVRDAADLVPHGLLHLS